MTHAAIRPPFVDASPAEIRAALLDEERPEFDRQYRRALDAARDSYSLAELENTLNWWRRTAQLTQADPAAHRRMLARAARTLETGELPAGSTPWRQLKDELGL